jgi:hypothetical protein
MTHWDGVRERVARLRKHDGDLTVFGARAHQFGLAHPLTSANVASAESQFGVALPDAYRSFLLEVGAGGAGPGYGMAELRTERGIWHWGHGDVLLGRLSEQALSTEEIESSWDELPEEPPQRADFADDQSFDNAVGAWHALEEEIRSRRFVGCIPLSHQGCGWEEWLVVSGVECGHVRVMGDSVLPVSPDFREHYLTWLRRVEDEVGIAPA